MRARDRKVKFTVRFKEQDGGNALVAIRSSDDFFNAVKAMPNAICIGTTKKRNNREALRIKRDEKIVSMKCNELRKPDFKLAWAVFTLSSGDEIGITFDGLWADLYGRLA